MRGGVPKNLQGVGIFGGEDRELGVVVQRTRKVDEFAVGARHQRFLGETRRNLMGDFGGGGSAGYFASGAVGQSDLDRVHAG